MKSLPSLAALIAAFIVAVVAAVWLYAFPGLHAPPQEPPREGGMKAFVLNDPPRDAPDMTFQRGDGKTFRLADFRGRVVLVNFWATWCAPCIRELPALMRFSATLDANAVTLVPVNVDRGGAAKAAEFLKEKGLQDLPLYLDPKMTLARALGVKSLPATFILDRRGKVVGGLDGYADWTAPEAGKLVNFYAARK